MATTALISLAEYMQTTYRPDREYIDGEVRERNVGEWEHVRLLALFAGWFGSQETNWSVVSAIAWRTQVSETRVRVPDLVLVKIGPQPDVLVYAAALIVEILSPDDTYADTQERAADYRRMGVHTVWIIDPKTRTGRYCVDDAWTAAERLIVPGTPVFADLNDLFAKLDRKQA
jgi:Uma2 family endonuclease